VAIDRDRLTFTRDLFLQQNNNCNKANETDKINTLSKDSTCSISVTGPQTFSPIYCPLLSTLQQVIDINSLLNTNSS